MHKELGENGANPARMVVSRRVSIIRGVKWWQAPVIQAFVAALICLGVVRTGVAWGAGLECADTLADLREYCEARLVGLYAGYRRGTTEWQCLEPGEILADSSVALDGECFAELRYRGAFAQEPMAEKSPLRVLLVYSPYAYRRGEDLFLWLYPEFFGTFTAAQWTQGNPNTPTGFSITRVIGRGLRGVQHGEGAAPFPEDVQDLQFGAMPVHITSSGHPESGTRVLHEELAVVGRWHRESAPPYHCELAVEAVIAGGLAHRMGVLEGDRIIAANDGVPTSLEDLTRLTKQLQNLGTGPLRVVRAGQPLVLRPSSGPGDGQRERPETE